MKQRTPIETAPPHLPPAVQCTVCIFMLFLPGDPCQYHRLHPTTHSGCNWHTFILPNGTVHLTLSSISPHPNKPSAFHSVHCPVSTVRCSPSSYEKLHGIRSDTWVPLWRTFIFTNLDGAPQKRLHPTHTSATPCFPFQTQWIKMNPEAHFILLSNNIDGGQHN